MTPITSLATATAALPRDLLGASPSGTAPLPVDPAKQAAQKFEAMFLSTVVDRMFASLPVDGPFGGGQAEATYRSFLADAYANSLARQGGVGIADTLYAELVRLQEGNGQ